MNAIAHDPQCILPVDLNETLPGIQPMCLLAETRKFNAADLLGFAEKLILTPANGAITAITTRAYGSSRCGRDSSGLHSERQ